MSALFALQGLRFRGNLCPGSCQSSPNKADPWGTPGRTDRCFALFVFSQGYIGLYGVI